MTLRSRVACTAAFATLLAAIAACSSFSQPTGQSGPAGPADASSDALDGGADGALGDAAGSCSYPCGAGACVDGGCQSFVVVPDAGGPVFGVAANNSTVYFTVPTQDAIYSSPRKGGFFGVVRSGLTGLGAVELGLAAGELWWARSTNSFQGVWSSTNIAAPLAMNSVPCSSFALVPDNAWFCSTVPEAPKVERRKGGVGPEALTAQSNVNFLAADEGNVFWSDQTGIYKAIRDAPNGSFGSLVIGGRSPVGLAHHKGWLYFDEPNGALARVRITDSHVEELARPISTDVPFPAGDVAVTPDGQTAFWALGAAIQGLALPP